MNKKEMFVFFSSQSKGALSDSLGTFICPLCLQAFDSPDGLNKAHLWPEALGGRIYTVSCSKCNAEMGTRIEKHEVERVKYHNQESIPFRQEIEGVAGTIGGLFSFNSVDDEPTALLEISSKHSNPKAIFQQNDVFETGAILRRQATLIFPTKFNPKVALLTYLHFAYMALFHLCGYTWVSTALAQHIRQQLNKPAKTLFPICLLSFSKEEILQPVKSVGPALLEITSPTELQGYLVATPELRNEGNRRKAIWLPRRFGQDYKVDDMCSHQGSQFSYKFLANISREPGGLAVYERHIN